MAKAKKVYVVQPPHGRHHESLWEIAEKCLGDGRRYPEIYRLNQHKEQPDGSRLRMADLIRPGWVLDMPDDARNVHIVPAAQPRTATLEEHPGKPAELDGRTHTAARAPADPPGTSSVPDRGPPRTPAPVPARTPAPVPARTPVRPRARTPPSSPTAPCPTTRARATPGDPRTCTARRAPRERP
nr:hypothetical protein GCM10020093_091490 [Planobispora longispora]